MTEVWATCSFKCYIYEASEICLTQILLQCDSMIREMLWRPIVVVKIVVSCAFFFPVTRMTRFQPMLHVLLFTCAWMYSSVLIHDLVHGLNPADAVYAHITCYYEKKKNAFLYSCCCITSALPNMFGSALKQYLFTFF